ncbi:glutathione S-transferase [Thalassotalea psychrophila]|uniref:Glutathione S-transferase n=1 Tax=Thalassotalea psychrophila TaxID=3065647 RepID=A0ABY9TQY8_9GAMM|nr:glutathione S-transferase [Colwelliaceae bacterium SQ149]
MNETVKNSINRNGISTDKLPILYSLRNCPYAMRARIAIFKSKQTVLLRDLVLTNKPQEMLVASPKGTVPVVVLVDGKVIEESYDVMLWALHNSDPDDLMHKQADENDNSLHSEMLNLIHKFDLEFKVSLEQYKCAKRYCETNIVDCREECEQYLQLLEQRLTKHLFLMSDKESLADIALLPFIRQFARVERQWYLQSPYPKVRQWLNNYLQSPMFTKVMAKHPLWLDSHEDVLFGDS